MIGDIDLLISHFILFLLGNYYYLQVVVEASDQMRKNEKLRENSEQLKKKKKLNAGNV